ncbi:MAG: glycosyltransferase family 39 protein [Planctomycetes bacterium]|nr:glycosyltransferase family 39 protein [Planctomycetota bacterium]
MWPTILQGQSIRVPVLLASAVVLAIAVGLFLRIQRIAAPITAIRETHSAMIAHNIVVDGPIGVLSPRVDFLGNGPGYVVQEFPTVTALAAITASHTSADWPFRLPALLFYLLLSLAVADFVHKYLGALPAVVATLFLALFPASISLSTSPQPDIAALAFAAATLAAVARYYSTGKGAAAIAAATFASAALLAKATYFPFLFLALAIFLRRTGWRAVFSRTLLITLFLIVLPLGLWLVRAYMLNQHSMVWPGLSVGDLQGDYLFQRGRLVYYATPAWYLRIAERVVESLSVPGAILALIALGIASVFRQTRHLAITIAASFAIYCIAFPFHIYSHPYYAAPVTLLAAIVVGACAGTVSSALRSRLPLAAIAGAVACAILVTDVSAGAQTESHEDRRKIAFGDAAQKIVPKGAPVIFAAKVITLWDGSLFYRAHRRGWKLSTFEFDPNNPEHARELAEARTSRRILFDIDFVPPAVNSGNVVSAARIEELRSLGAQYFGYFGSPVQWFRTGKHGFQDILAHYPVIDSTPDWMFVDLRTRYEDTEWNRTVQPYGASSGFQIS